MPQTILEVIALGPADARAATDGGADRLELVADMDHAGLTPSVETFEQVKAVTDLPVRVMLRNDPGYAVSNLDALLATAATFRRAGADEFVLGFLTADGDVDRPVVAEVAAFLDGCRWTFHRAIDHARDRTSAWEDLADLPGLDTVLTAGAPTGIPDGLPTLVGEAQTQPTILAGGGLQSSHVAPLRAAGVTAFHIGTGARPGGSWTAPADASLVAHWREVVG